MGIPPHKLIQEVETRWNSTHDMMARLYEQRGPVGAALGSLRTDLAALTSAEYHSMSECLEVLSPLKVATVELSAEKNVSGTKIIPLVRMLRHNIAVKQSKVTDVMAGQLCSHLVRLMGEKLRDTIQPASILWPHCWIPGSKPCVFATQPIPQVLCSA